MPQPQIPYYDALAVAEETGREVSAVQIELAAEAARPVLLPNQTERLADKLAELDAERAKLEAEHASQLVTVHQWDSYITQLQAITQRQTNAHTELESLKASIVGRKDWLRQNVGSAYAPHNPRGAACELAAIIASVPLYEEAIQAVDDERLVLIKQIRAFGRENNVPKDRWPSLPEDKADDN